ncbi:MerR family transcriptional regulator [Bradyrhizobium sp. SZCCHNS2096]|uniref:MerR family transcriptional regulator n=1 Tax=Bradyrhizobium sp. SZCCHNS2096 TaxID=3057309 RepID=UPI0029171005|nr:hypothetical protein [Bradyrhizobium sp. SZCCHNS2096]
MLREYSPHATAYAARCKPDTLRDWRRQGLFDDLGERKGKGHLFTLSDVARISVAAFIARNGSSLREAFEIVRDRGRMIDAVAAAEGNVSGSCPEYVLTFVVHPDVSFPASITSAPVSNVEFATPPFGALQVNVSLLIRSALGRLSTFEANHGVSS